jgi:hypothetical protein
MNFYQMLGHVKKSTFELQLELEKAFSFMPGFVKHSHEDKNNEPIIFTDKQSSFSENRKCQSINDAAGISTSFGGYGIGRQRRIGKSGICAKRIDNAGASSARHRC